MALIYAAIKDEAIDLKLIPHQNSNQLIRNHYFPVQVGHIYFNSNLFVLSIARISNQYFLETQSEWPWGPSKFMSSTLSSTSSVAILLLHSLLLPFDAASSTRISAQVSPFAISITTAKPAKPIYTHTHIETRNESKEKQKGDRARVPVNLAMKSTILLCGLT